MRSFLVLPICLQWLNFAHLTQARVLETCSPMKNQGAFFTVELEVGTSAPGGSTQVFNAVADTGSNAVVIPSCLCEECLGEGRCFRGTNRSTTFFIEDKGGLLKGVAIMFGSGPIQAVIATDVVKLADVKANMSESLLLMTSQQLQVPKGFEGILGMGVPQHRGQAKRSSPHLPSAGTPSDQSSTQDNAAVIPGFLEQAQIPTFSMCFRDQGEDGSLHLGAALNDGLTSIGEMHWGLELFGVSVGKDHVPVKMSDKALCTEVPHGQHTACGSIPDSGSTAIMAPFEHLSAILDAVCDNWPRCIEAAKKMPDPEQKPTQGTMPFLQTQSAELKTVRRHAPVPIEESMLKTVRDKKNPLEDLLRKLGFGGDGEGFPPMSEDEGTDTPDISEQIGVEAPQDTRTQLSKKGAAVQQLLMSCEEWLNTSTTGSKDGSGIHELPSLNFHLRGGNKKEQIVELSAWSWVSQMQAEEVNHTLQSVHGIQVDVQKPTGKKRTVCAPIIAGMDFNTERNGPVWILGGPLYYEYTVGFNINDKSVHFTAGGQEGCNACAGGTVGSVLQGSSELALSRGTAVEKDSTVRVSSPLPRQMSGPWRRSTIDTSKRVL
mmetsp:Transcript_21963/g.51391  ORF Transcript_21963/g.51391 Transcript_21963/m.51391 type:complete len:602 (+) Transcript_21963:72-1877(+)